MDKLEKAVVRGNMPYLYQMRLTPTNLGGGTKQKFLDKLPKGVIVTESDDSLILTQQTANKSKETGKALEQLMKSHPVKGVGATEVSGLKKYYIDKKEFFTGGVKEAMVQLRALGAEVVQKGNQLFVKLPYSQKEDAWQILKDHSINKDAHLGLEKKAKRTLRRLGKDANRHNVKKVSIKFRRADNKRVYMHSGLSGQRYYSNKPLEEFANKKLAKSAKKVRTKGFVKWDKPLAEIREAIVKGVQIIH